MAAKRTKKELEAKIADLEAKLEKISSELAGPDPKPAASKLRGTLPKGSSSAPPPKPAASKPRGTLPKGSSSAPPPKPQQEPPQTKFSTAQALEEAHSSYPMTDTHDYKSKVPGYTPAPNRYFGRTIAPQGTVSTSDWNAQKVAVTGYTAPSNKYFATRKRMAYHPAGKRFEGFDMRVEKASAQQPPEPKKNMRGTLPKGF